LDTSRIIRILCFYDARQLGQLIDPSGSELPCGLRHVR